MLGFLIAIAVLQQTPAVSKDAIDVTEFNRLEAVWNDAHLNGDAETLDALWANDLVVIVASMRLINKADALEMVRSNRMPFTKYETSEIRVKHFTDSAVVTGRLLRERSMNGQTITENWRFTKVYVRSGGRWRVTSWHGSPAPQ
jgi:ketosteroid isomerase-like protein